MPLWLPQHRPSWKQGLARNQAGARYPGLWDGLVGAWLPSLGPTGTTLRDISGYGNDGTLQTMDPAVDWVATEKGYALNFEDAQKRVLLPDAAKFFAPFTVTVTFRHHTLRAGNLFGGQDTSNGVTVYHDGGAEHWFYYINDDSTRSQYRSPVGLTSLNEWYTFSLTWDGTYVAGSSDIWLDGVEQTDWTRQMSEATLDTNVDWGASPFRIGNEGGFDWRNFSGYISSFVVHNRVLSPNEIRTLYENPHALVQQRARFFPAAGAAAVTGHPTMRRWGGVPYMTPGAALSGRSW